MVPHLRKRILVDKFSTEHSFRVESPNSKVKITALELGYRSCTDGERGVSSSYMSEPIQQWSVFKEPWNLTSESALEQLWRGSLHLLKCWRPEEGGRPSRLQEGGSSPQAQQGKWLYAHYPVQKLRVILPCGLENSPWKALSSSLYPFSLLLHLFIVCIWWGGTKAIAIIEVFIVIIWEAHAR